MRKSLLLSLLVFLLAALCLLTVGASEKVVFVSSGATGTGASAADPVGTLAGAYNALGNEGGTLVLMNKYTITSATDLPKHTGKISWTSVYGGVDYRTSGAAICWNTSYRIGFGGPTEIDNFTFKDGTTGAVLAANYHDLTIGENVLLADANGVAAQKMYLTGGPNNNNTLGAMPAGAQSTVTLKTGGFHTVIAFSRNVSGLVHYGTVTLNIENDVSVKNLYLGAFGAAGGTTVLNLTDSASVSTMYLAATGAKTTGTITVNAQDTSKINAISQYLASYFVNANSRILHYAETATLPASLSTYFDAITVIEPEEPEIPDVPTVLEVVYLSEGANGTGESATSPVGTFTDAFARLDAAQGGTVVLVGTYAINVNVQLPDYSGEVLITSVYDGVDYRESGAKLVFSGEHHLATGGPTVFDGIRLQCTNVGSAQVASIAGNFYPLTLGADVQTVDASGANAALLYIVGGPNNDTTKGALQAGESSTLTVKSGSYQGITTFSRRIANLSHTGTMHVTVSGDTYVKDLYLGTMGTAAAGGTTVFTMEDTVSVDTLHLANYTNTKTNGTVTVTVKDNATVATLSKSADTYFVKADAKTLHYALTASVPSTADFSSVSLVGAKYVTVADRALANLTYASVNALDVTAHATEGLTLPYSEELSAFTLTLTYIEGSINTTYTYSVAVIDGTAVATLTGTETFDGSVVYVMDGATGNGFSPASPCGSLEAAIALLPKGGTVVLVGETTLSVKCTLPSHTGTITYTSVYDGVDYREDGARLYFPNGITVLLGGEAIWKDISIHTDTYAYITAGFHPLTFDTGVSTTWTEETETKPADHQNGLRLAGGYNNYSLGEVTDGRNASITLKSGFFRHVHGFSRYTGKTTYTGTATVTVEGTATVNKLFAGAVANSATAANAKVTVSDDAVIYNLFLGGNDKTALLTGRFDLVIYGGDIYEIDALFYYTAKDCIKTVTYDVNTVPDGFPYLAEMAQFNVVQTFCERDNTHKYSDPYASEFDENIQLKRCSVCDDIQFVGELPEALGENVIFVAEGGLGDGSHPSIPTSDLYAAFEQLKDNGGTIVIMNAYTLDTNTTQKLGGAPAFFQEPLHTGAITVTSVYGETDYRDKGAKFVFDGNVDYKLGGPVTFDHIVFDATASTTENNIVARYHPVVFGADVEMLRDMDDAYKLVLIGGYKHFRYTDFTDVVIEDGLIEMVNPARIIDVNPATGDYTIDDPVNVISNGTTYAGFLRAEAANAFNTMFADMVEDGVTAPTHIGYAWRGFLEQYDGYTRQLGNIRVNYGYTFEQSHKEVIKSCSIPGASEHHLGYAFDFHDAIFDPNGHGRYDETEGWEWIMRNGYKYGIILRFTKKDTATTGFIYEAWHFRYIGVEHATAIAKLNSNGDPVQNSDMLLTPEWCLEDYAGLVLGMYGLDSSVTVNGGTFAHIEGGSVGCDDLPLTGEEVVTIGENATVKPTGKSYDLVFFSAGAEGDGLTAASPVGTLPQAYAKLGEDGGTLVWMSELSVGAATEMPAHTGTVTITSLYDGVDYRESGAALKYTAGIRVAFNGPTVIDGFKFIGFSGGCLLCANFNPLTIGEDVLTVNTNGKTEALITLIGGGNNNLSVGTLDAEETNTVTVNSGAYVHIVAFSAYNSGLSHTGTVYLNVGGDVTANAIILGAKATSSGGSAVLTITDNATTATLLLANHGTDTKMNGTVTVYAKGNATVQKIERYLDTYFTTEDARTLYYEDTATLPANLGTYFNNITLLDTIERTGDANGDGVTTLIDVIRALRASADDTVEISMAADMNRDRTITVVDVLLLLKAILNA